MTKKAVILIGIFGVILLIGLAVVNKGGSNQQPTTQSLNTPQGSTNTKSAITSPTSQNPQDVVPGLYPNPIQNNSTKEGFIIASAMAENNTDPATGKAVSDHLEITLKNTSNQDLSNFEVYYTITDTQTKKQEGYYKKLTGFILKSGQTQTVNFDNKQGNNHFSANTNSIYYTSANTMSFHVIVSTPGFKPQIIDATKAAGGAETKD